MARHTIVIAFTASALLGASAAADYTYTDTFESGWSVGEWTFGTGYGHVQWEGGNPGAFFRDNGLVSFFPRPRTNGESLFTGDLRAAGVTSIGIDLKTFYVEFSAESRPLSVVLLNYNGTPYDYEDDWDDPWGESEDDDMPY